MAGVGEREAEGRVEGGLTEPSSWFTGEMVEAVAKALYSAPMPVAADQDWWDRRLPEDIELDLRDARIALEAIAPMIEERLTMAHHDGYVDGWNERGEDQ